MKTNIRDVVLIVFLLLCTVLSFYVGKLKGRAELIQNNNQVLIGAVANSLLIAEETRSLLPMLEQKYLSDISTLVEYINKIIIPRLPQ